ncbi:MAG: hypothetical protein A2095_11680 [Sphingomonadales bacterium GWF1_63_6]|nr:MAG: hypothetical protein A2095_11680 [Sphingomonadales bacterium GWF1_63_6]OHD02857.1 MAG: hypothetical protein A3H25_01280 [Sphingomonadales bacterium RIFCSPLOWO2_12_FULL_63_15]
MGNIARASLKKTKRHIIILRSFETKAETSNFLQDTCTINCKVRYHVLRQEQFVIEITFKMRIVTIAIIAKLIFVCVNNIYIWIFI